MRGCDLAAPRGALNCVRSRGTFTFTLHPQRAEESKQSVMLRGIKHLSNVFHCTVCVFLAFCFSRPGAFPKSMEGMLKKMFFSLFSCVCAFLVTHGNHSVLCASCGPWGLNRG